MNEGTRRRRRVVVTGGSGRIGGYVAPALRAAGHRVESLDLRPAVDGTPTQTVDIMDIAALRRAFASADAVVHLAGLDMDAPCASEDFIRVNVAGSWNVLQAAQELGVPKVVLASSVTATGLNEARPDWAPHYLPIDEAHELRPRHPYGVSKMLIERAGAAIADGGVTEVIALRPMLVLRPETIATAAARGRDPATRSLCYHVAAEDVADAFCRAVDVDGIGFGAFFITAADTYADEPTLARVARLWPDSRMEIRRRDVYASDPRASAFDGTLARRVLGFTPSTRFHPAAPHPSTSSG
jgi:nucleoside-diphosphate-sugar epimerase